MSELVTPLWATRGDAPALSDDVLNLNLNRYLLQSGWQKQPPGPAGSLWRNSRDSDTFKIAVPEPVEPGGYEWNGVVSRIARFEHRAAADIAIAIVTQYVDIARLAADNGQGVTGSIPLNVGVGLVKSAYTMLRAAGTTARRPRAQIAGNYSSRGDEVAKQAQMAHTEDGSYVVPIWIPLTPPPAGGPPTLLDENESEQRLAVEVSERRVTRTLAQSLEAVQKFVIQPDRAPSKASDLLPLIAAGGSRELVVAVQEVLEHPSVTQLAARFSWAGGLMPPGGVAESVVLEAETLPLLRRTAELLKSRPNYPGRQIYTGKIVLIMHRVDDPFGIIGIDTMSNNRSCEIHVKLDLDTLDKAYEWARIARAVLVEGTAERASPSRKLQIENPIRVVPLDEMFQNEDSS
jgi:hypothetical protein